MDLEITCTKILLLAADIKWTTNEDDRIQIQSTGERLHHQLSKLISSNDILPACRLAPLYLIQPDQSVIARDTLETLVSNIEIPPAFRVSILLNLAKNAQTRSMYELCDDYLERANAMLPTYQQVTDALEINFIRSSRPSIEVESKTQALLDLHTTLHAIRDRRFQIQVLSVITNIGSELGGAGFTLAITANVISTKIAYTTGSRLLWAQLQLGLLARLNQQGGTLGKIMETEALFESTMMPDVPFIKYLFCSVFGNVYEKRGDREKAIQWTDLALKYVLSTKSAKDISVAMENSLRAKSIDRGMSDEAVQRQQQELRTAYIEAINSDRELNLVEEQFRKILDLILLMAKGPAHGSSLDDGSSSAEALLDEAHRLAEHQMTVNEDGSLLAKYSQVQATRLMNQHATEKARDVLMEVVQTFVKHSMHFQSAFASTQVGLCDLQLWKEEGKAEHLNNAIRRFDVAYDMFQLLSLLDEAAKCQFFQAHAWDLARSSVVAGENRKNYTTNCLNCLVLAENLRDRTRQELSILPGLQSLRAKQSLSSDDLNQKIYRTAIYVSNFEGRVQDAWNWIQRYKARSLSDLLGIGCIIPSILSEKIQSNAEVCELLKQEAALAQRLERGQPETRLSDRVELDTLRQKMKEFPLLDELFALREGRSEQISDLDWLFHLPPGTGHQVAVVDWICVANFIYIVILDETLKPYMERLATSVDELKTWVSRNLTSSRRRTILEKPEERSPLREIDSLVYPLTYTTKPDTLLILSPSGPLHSIPIHALHLPGRQLLIERNPVVYSPSLSVLHQCVRRALPGRDPTSFAVAFGVYENPFETSEEKAVKLSIESCAGLFGGKSYFGKVVTNQCFRTRSETASLIHFHGHTIRGHDNILEEGIELYSGEEATINGELGKLRLIEANMTLGVRGQQTTESRKTGRISGNEVRKTVSKGVLHSAGGQSEYDDSDESFTDEENDVYARFSVSDVFSLKLNAPVVNLIACQSAHQEIAPGDEPLGLISAFLYSGATSVIGTLWPIQSIDGRIFANILYNDINGQSGNLSKTEIVETLVDLARSMQRSVITLRCTPGSESPYHWAPFILYGAWQVQRF